VSENVDKRIGGRLLTVPELAEILSVPESWVYSRTATGEIPHVCVGRYKRFRLGEVLRWLESRYVS